MKRSDAGGRQSLRGRSFVPLRGRCLPARGHTPAGSSGSGGRRGRGWPGAGLRGLQEHERAGARSGQRPQAPEPHAEAEERHQHTQVDQQRPAERRGRRRQFRRRQGPGRQFPGSQWQARQGAAQAADGAERQRRIALRQPFAEHRVDRRRRARQQDDQVARQPPGEILRLADAQTHDDRHAASASTSPTSVAAPSRSRSSAGASRAINSGPVEASTVAVAPLVWPVPSACKTWTPRSR